MAQLIGLIVSGDDDFTPDRHGCSAPAPSRSASSTTGWRDGTSPDLVIVDIRGDHASAMSAIERMRAASPNAGIFAMASEADPDLILQSMRAGANEFFTWPPPTETFHEALRRTAARRARRRGASRRRRRWCSSAPRAAPARRPSAVNCARRDRAAEQAPDDHRRSQAGPRRGRVVPRRAQPLQPAGRPRQPAPARQGVPPGARGQAQVRARDSRRVRSLRSAWRRRSGALEEVFRLLGAAVPSTSSSTPGAR